MSGLSLLAFKGIGIAITFSLALIGIVPLRVPISQRLIAVGMAFSAGVFLSMGLMHMLEESSELWKECMLELLEDEDHHNGTMADAAPREDHDHDHDHGDHGGHSHGFGWPTLHTLEHYPFGAVCALLGFGLVLLIERVLVKSQRGHSHGGHAHDASHQHQHQHQHQAQSYQTKSGADEQTGIAHRREHIRGLDSDEEGDTRGWSDHAAAAVTPSGAIPVVERKRRSLSDPRQLGEAMVDVAGAMSPAARSVDSSFYARARAQTASSIQSQSELPAPVGGFMRRATLLASRDQLPVLESVLIDDDDADADDVEGVDGVVVRGASTGTGAAQVRRRAPSVRRQTDSERLPLLANASQASLPGVAADGAAPHMHAGVTSHILLAVLSIHSVLEGLAIGVENRSADVIGVIFAVSAHKAFEAIALGVTYRYLHTPPCRALSLLFLFALTTPVGIGIGMALTSAEGLATTIISAVSLGCAAGTFLYVGVMEVIAEAFETTDDVGCKFCSLVTGAVCISVLMAFVSS